MSYADIIKRLTSTVGALREASPDNTLDDIENILRFNGVTWAEFQWLDEKPGLWGNSEASGGEWHYHVRQLRNARGYRGNEVTVNLEIKETEYRDGSNPDAKQNGMPYWYVTTAMPGSQTDDYKLIKALEPGSVLGRDFTLGAAIKDYIRSFKDYSDALDVRLVEFSETDAQVVITVHRNRNERN